MALAENSRDQDLTFIKFEGVNGNPLFLRRAFIVAAIGLQGESKYTSVTVDEQNTTSTYNVKDRAENIEGPFARFGNLLVNPAYVASIYDNKSNNAATHPTRIDFRAPKAMYFNVYDPIETVHEKIMSAAARGPC